MIIRDFKLSDLNEVVKIEFNSFDDPYPVDVLIQLYNIGAGFLVAELAHHVVGYVIFWIKDDFGHIVIIAVDEKYRSMKIGSLLLEKAIFIFKRNNIFDIKLEVRKSNVRARYFYQRNNFVQVSEENNYYSDGETAIIMKYVFHDS